MSFLISLSREWDMPEFSMPTVFPHRNLALLKNVTDYSFRWWKMDISCSKNISAVSIKKPCAYYHIKHTYIYQKLIIRIRNYCSIYVPSHNHTNLKRWQYRKKRQHTVLRKKVLGDIITNCNMLDKQISYLHDTDRFRERQSHINPLCKILSQTRWSLTAGFSHENINWLTQYLAFSV